MSKIKFSEKQEEAISAIDGTFLISAGAGSGKTAVLTERIFRIAKAKQTLDGFLVLTFTENAAGEMKSRFREKLLDDPSTEHLASEVDNAHIETFDAFSLYLAKKYFYLLGVSKDFSIVDNSVVDIKRKKTIDEVFEAHYQNKDVNFLKLIDNYATKDDTLLRTYIERLLVKSNSRADNYGFLRDLLKNFDDPNFVVKIINELFEETRSDLKVLKEKAYELENVEDATQIVEFVDSLLDIKTYDELYDVLSDKDRSSFPKKISTKENTDGELRDAISSFYKKIKFDDDRNYGKSDDIRRQYEAIRPLSEEIISLCIEIENKVDEFKKEHNAFSFGDVSRMVMKLLENEEVKNEISNQFDIIMIDEYQDTNDIQETVISKISRNNVYMVGDVKQSIYRFRGADCSIFQRKYLDFKSGKGGQEIDLNTSYRSRKEVVDFINDLFVQLMRKDNNAIDYMDGHKFIFGRTEYLENPSSSDYRPEVYEYSYAKSAEVVEIESNIIVNDIKRKIKEKYLVYDNKLKGNRLCSFKDFAIIMDRGTTFERYRQTFASSGIPLNVVNKEELFKSDVLLAVKSLVKMLYYSLLNEYEGEYRHAYFSVARSFLYQYPDDKLYEISKAKSYLNEPFAQKIELIKEKLRFAPIKDMLLTIYSEFDIYSKISRITQYYANTHKLEQLLTVSESIDALNYTLKDFVEYFDDLDKEDRDIDYSSKDAVDDSVTLINIHKSKGLEYPIIYFPGLNRQFNRTDVNNSFNFTDKYGISIPSTESEENSLLVHLTRNEINRADLEEKIRLLYVAFTRAKEKIIILHGNKDSKYKFKKQVDLLSMNEILETTDLYNRYASKYSDEVVELDLSKKDSKGINPITLKEINIAPIEVKKSRASKSRSEEVSDSLLEFGTELHAYLEASDFESKKLPFVVPKRMFKYVNNVLYSPLFKDVKNSELRHEFHFYDEKNNVEGFIDCLIIKDNEIDIVDYKLKNVSDLEYDKQLRIYKEYISSYSDKPIKMYLLAAITGEIREVYDE